ncbi:MAG: Crp/Fnr family transcriptional regulator [Ardenticatenales bacterium]|nr:Crp/Fnr family transcriptional regulator [Ardenticatenales bacterium]
MSRLSPLDMLALSDNEQEILRCLSRQPRMTIREIALTTKIASTELESLLNQMVHASQLVEQIHEGERTFAVRFTSTKRQVRNLPASIRDILDQPLDHFLDEIPLTAHLSMPDKQRLLAKSKVRTLLPDEVFLWQGKMFEQIGLVRSGLLKKSRLQGRQEVGRTMGYVHRKEWFGLSEALGERVSSDTYTAVTECEVVLWSVPDLIAFLTTSASFSLSIGRLLSHQLHLCQRQHVHGLGRLWAVETLDSDEPATLLALNLAALASHNDGEGRRKRVILWDTLAQGTALLDADESDKETLREVLDFGIGKGFSHSSGFDVLTEVRHRDYPAEVELDIFLTFLQSHYDYIICDIGSSMQDELLWRLRGQAETLLTLTRDCSQASRGQEHWRKLQAIARPGQKRLLALVADGESTSATNMDPAFHLVLPNHAPVTTHWYTTPPLVETDSEGVVSRAFKEVYRRLSLNHTIGIFIPSTLDVNHAIDNGAQVQRALSFLGALFGGATRSDAEGVWRSEDNGLVVEQVTIVRTFVSQKALETHLDEVIAFATQMKQEMRQEAIALDIDNHLMLV